MSSKTPKKAYFVEPCSTDQVQLKNLFEIQIDSDLNFDKHISLVCNKVGKKTNVLNRLVNFISFDKRRVVMKAFIESQFNYCPLMSMFHSG